MKRTDWTPHAPSDEDLQRADEYSGSCRVTADPPGEGAVLVSDLTAEIRRLRAERQIDDLDVQERAGLVGVWLTPADDGQMPLISLELIGGRKRYARVWIDGRDQVEWGWVLPDKSVAVWRDPELSTEPGGPRTEEDRG